MFKKEAIKERKEFNNELYNKIFKITKKPGIILDLGCGLNPLSFPYKDIAYLASDIDVEAMRKVKKHFKKNKIRGEVFYFDLNNTKELKKIKKVDIALMFKVLDDLDKKTIKEALNNIKTKYFVVSFATRTISGKRMNSPKRTWFEKLIKSKICNKIRYFNEVFYVIKK